MSNMNDIHSIDHEYNLNNQKLEESEHVSEQNKQAISRFSDKCFAEGLSKSRVRRYLSSFHSLLKMAPDGFDLKAQIETEIRDSKKLAENLISRVVRHEDSEPRDFLRAAKEIQQVQKRHIEMLKEIGLNIEGSENSKKDENNLRRLLDRVREVHEESAT